MELLVAGAAGTVTGSKYLLRAGDRQLLVDCGLFQGLKQLRLLNWQPFPFTASRLDGVVLSHGHIDHSGALPLLWKAGYRGVIHTSAPTIDLCRILLPDSGYLHEQEAAFLNRHKLSRHKPALPLYTQAEAKAVLDHFSPLPFARETKISDGFNVTLGYGGHILGAATVLVRAGRTRVLFSGDLGRSRDPIMRPPDPPPAADWVVMESTYGNRDHGRDDAETVLADIISRTAGRGGTVVIPAFAVGRAQRILYHLERLKAASRIPDLPVFLDSPMAQSASDLMCRHRDQHRLGTKRCDLICKGARYVRDVEESKSLDTNHFPKIILSASGMATGGRVVHHLKVYLRDPRSAVVFTGFQAAGTRGAHLVSGAKTVKIHGAHIPVRAEVANLNMLSAHADRKELLAWLKGMPRPPKGVIITHGEPEAADALRAQIEDELDWPCRVPFLGEVIDLDGRPRRVRRSPKKRKA